MMTGADVKVAGALARESIKVSLPLFKKISDSVQQFYNDGFLDYYSLSLDKYKEIKTLLHRQPTSFYSIYYPVKLKYSNKVVETTKIKTLFKTNHCITIIGDAGSGKSTLIKHLFMLSFAENYKAPIFVALRDLGAENCNLEAFIRQTILKNKLSPSDDYLNKLLESGEFIFFLDGYDEIKSTEKHHITTSLESFIDKYPNNNFVLTSRPYSNIEYFKNFHNYYVNDLDKNDIVEFIKLQITDTVLSDKIIESVKDGSPNFISSFLKNSLLLTLYILTYSTNQSIPTNKYVFYRRVFDVLYAEHDSATKVGYEREIKTKLNQEQLEKILQIFSFLSFFDSYFVFDRYYINKTLLTIKGKITNVEFDNNSLIDDLKLAIGLWIEDGGLFSFAHRSMQEYFAALYVRGLNEQAKTKVYNKILTTMQRSFDFKNFLSLCEEIERTDYLKFYLIPVLKLLRALFINSKGKLRLDLPYLKLGMHYNRHNPKKGMSFSVNYELELLIEVYLEKVDKSIINKMSTIFLSNLDNAKLLEYITITDSRRIDDDAVNFNIKNNAYKNPGFAEVLKDIGFLNILTNAVQNIDNELKKAEDELKMEKDIEDSFVNLI